MRVYLALNQLIIGNNYCFSALTTGFYLDNKPSITCNRCNRKIFSLVDISDKFEFSEKDIVQINVLCIGCANNLELWYEYGLKNIASSVKTVIV